jgi:hypothetical protein
MLAPGRSCAKRRLDSLARTHPTATPLRARLRPAGTRCGREARAGAGLPRDGLREAGCRGNYFESPRHGEFVNGSCSIAMNRECEGILFSRIAPRGRLLDCETSLSFAFAAGRKIKLGYNDGDI